MNKLPTTRKRTSGYGNYIYYNSNFNPLTFSTFYKFQIFTLY